ncbi:dimethylaniline monooxygenase 2 [Caerostris darwini]|uniref:Flavin-containing monooxygenase n=1 Tax=Caerostris darwini TaxID=1538125 RepID=A0AAV4P8T0_9ARAC|nr:dimethylaniline monooxygenase 2 [Caerostris darwini]
MASPKTKIAVVGGGLSGAGSLAQLKEEGGFELVCFEKTDKPGGTWCYREESIEAVASIMSTTIINHSKEMGAFSDFPPPKEYNTFMRHSELYQYASEYAKSKDIFKYIQYNSEVIEVRRAKDYIETGRWIVTVKNTISNEVSTDVYDGVLLCVGHINRPKMPYYPGQDLFKGDIIHTHTLKRVEKYREKNVIVVGMGCSGLDAAVETSNVAKQVYLSTRSGAHVIRRVGPHGYPFDYLLVRRFLFMLIDILPFEWTNYLLENIYLDPQYNRDKYAVKPDHHILSKDPVINDHIHSKFFSGSVIQKPDIERFTENGVIFKGDTEVTEADVVIMATGYTWKFPFLEEGIIVKEGDKINLYKLMFPPHLEHATLAVLGFILPFGPGFPIGELQCRFAAQVLARKCKLPSEKEMVEDINKRYNKNVSKYGRGEKMSIRVDYVQFCDELASQFGVKPNLLKILLTDPKLFFQIFFGPHLSYQYRLQGPHSWDGARNAIMISKDRMVYPVTKRSTQENHGNIFIRILTSILKYVFF